jgi:hypothetical protein
MQEPVRHGCACRSRDFALSHNVLATTTYVGATSLTCVLCPDSARLDKESGSVERLEQVASGGSAAAIARRVLEGRDASAVRTATLLLNVDRRSGRA